MSPFADPNADVHLKARVRTASWRVVLRSTHEHRAVSVSAAPRASVSRTHAPIGGASAVDRLRDHGCRCCAIRDEVGVGGGVESVASLTERQSSRIRTRGHRGLSCSGGRMDLRTFWINLGWLVVLIVTIATPLALDARGSAHVLLEPGVLGHSAAVPLAGVPQPDGIRHRPATTCAALVGRHDRGTGRGARPRARPPDVPFSRLRRGAGHVAVRVVCARPGRAGACRGTALLRHGPDRDRAHVRVRRRALAGSLSLR